MWCGLELVPHFVALALESSELVPHFVALALESSEQAEAPALEGLCMTRVPCWGCAMLGSSMHP